MKKLQLFISMILFFGTLNAQEINVYGRVTDSKDKLGIIGATILVKGNSVKGTITDTNGNYNINVSTNDTLSVSYIGYHTLDIPVGGRKKIDVILSETDILIDEFVVTALGMKREKKALGYSVQEVNGADLQKTKELNVLNSLSGKIAGVNITQGGGGLDGGGARIVIRGETSLAGNNTPLFVIDGVPGEANDVASDDIESVSVLKGPAAAALYGSRAAAGVVLITTKSGKGKEAGTIGIEINSNTSFQTTFILPDYQNQFGQGTGGLYSYYDGNNGVWPNGSISNDDYRINWGPEFDGKLRPQFNGEKPWVAYPNNVKDFYNTGFTLNNNVALTGGSDDGHYRLSYTNIQQKGIIPNTGVVSHKIDFGGGWNLTKKLRVSTNVKYKNTTCDNNESVDVRLYPRNIDIAALEDYWVPGLEGIQQLQWRASSDNPYFTMHENTKAYQTNRIIGNISLNYQFTDQLSFMGRIGLVENHKESTEKTAFSSVGANNQYGSFNLKQDKTQDLNADFILSYIKKISSLFSINASLGGNQRRYKNSWVKGEVDQLLIPDVYNLGNHRVAPKATNSWKEKQVNSLYGFTNIGFRDKIYLDITARNDWSSTLPVDNNSYFYPSFTLSGLMHDLIALPEAISFWKIRANWAQVGNDTDPYQLQDSYSWENGENGIATISQDDTKANANLKPELTSAYELGTDFRLFKNRLMFDLTYYNSLTSNQILKVEVSPTTGYNYILKNAGKIKNQGFELMIQAKMVETKDFTWDLSLNWARDRAIVEEYDKDNPEAHLSRSVTTHLFVEDRIGERRGALYGQDYERAPTGEILFTKSGDTQRGDYKYLGNYNPDWMASMYNELNYKNLTLSFLFDLRFGGAFYSETNYKLNIYGLSEATLLGGYGPDGEYQAREYIVPDGVIYVDDEYRQLTSEDLIESGLSAGGLTGQQYWENMMDSEIPMAVIYDATYLKLREIALSYKIPKKVVDKTFFQSASVSFVGRNIAVWTKIPNVDPETYSESDDKQDIPGYDAGGIPSVRSFAFNVNLKF